MLVVDDSGFMRIALRKIIEADGDLHVAGEAADGFGAVDVAARLRPDLVVMDLAMPGLDGLEATRRIMALPSPPAIVVVSGLARAGSAAALAAFERGAVAALWKDSGLGGPDLARLDRELRPILRRCAAARGQAAAGGAAVAVPPSEGCPSLGALRRPDLVVFGGSTGAPDALATLLLTSGAPPVPLVVAQHMPAGIAPDYAAYLLRRTGLRTVVAADGTAPESGVVTLLPGGTDGALARRKAGGWVLRLATTAAPVHPSVDVLFRSAAATAARPLGIVLSGMGRDGVAGAGALAARGMAVLAQSPETCLVGGMPGAALAAGACIGRGDPAWLGASLAALFAAPSGRTLLPRPPGRAALARPM